MPTKRPDQNLCIHLWCPLWVVFVIFILLRSFASAANQRVQGLWSGVLILIKRILISIPMGINSAVTQRIATSTIAFTTTIATDMDNWIKQAIQVEGMRMRNDLLHGELMCLSYPFRIILYIFPLPPKNLLHSQSYRECKPLRLACNISL